MKTVAMVRTALVLAVVCLASGCAQSTAGRAGAPRPPVIGTAPAEPASFLAAVTGLPWRAYIQGPRQTLIVERAQLILAVQCMHRRGFTPFSQSMMQYGIPDLVQDPGGPYGLIDERKAMRYGFHLSPAEQASYHPASVRLTARQIGALRICLSDANSALDGGRTIDPRYLVNQLAARAWRLASADARVRAATGRWSVCMRARGFRYSAPPGQAQWISKGPTASRIEIRVASADAACTASTDLAGIFFAVDAGYQRELIRAESAALAPIGTAIKAENARAAEVLARQPRRLS
jgi:hypothetical protein